MKKHLALFGGSKTREKPFPPHPIIGEEEKEAVRSVLDSGRLSSFIAQSGEPFFGGERVREFERAFREFHDVEFAVAFNSATSALHAAVVAVGVQPGDEVVVPPYTFTATATCVLMHNAIPSFADIQSDICCLDPKAVVQAVTQLTRAMIPVHLFGHPADMDGLLAVAQQHNLRVIEDCAQAPGAMYKGRRVGTMGDCGVFSFTESKTITTGEGGMLITDDPNIADVACRVRNHGEVLQMGDTRTPGSAVLGWNYRMPEIEAAIGTVQLRRLNDFNAMRIELADHLTARLRSLPGLEPPTVYPDCTHVYFAYPFGYDEDEVGIGRHRFAAALSAEGIPVSAGYAQPLYMNPIYRERLAAASHYYQGDVSYDRGLCPVAEELHDHSLLSFGVIRPPADASDVDSIVVAINKILDYRDEFERT